MNNITIASRELPYEIAEELKTLRTNIILSGDDKRVILVTSCRSGEGKSETSLELARSLAELDKDVLLVDADLRKSVFYKKVVSGSISAGLTNYLVGQSGIENVVYQSEEPHLQVIPAGAVPPNPSELLAHQRMGNLLQSAKENYDYVIVDAAPLGLVVDASVLASQCDGAILILEAGTIPYRFAQDVADKLRNTQCPVLGAVLNKVDYRNDKYYGYGYGKYDKYYSKRYEQYYK